MVLSDAITIPVKLASKKKQALWQKKEKWLKDFHALDKPTTDGTYKRRYFNGKPFDERTIRGGKVIEYKTYNKNGSLHAHYNGIQMCFENDSDKSVRATGIMCGPQK